MIFKLNPTFLKNRDPDPNITSGSAALIFRAVDGAIYPPNISLQLIKCLKRIKSHRLLLLITPISELPSNIAQNMLRSFDVK